MGRAVSARDDFSEVVRAWTWPELQAFLIEHGLIICDGLGDRDGVGITRRGNELWAALEAMRRLESADA